MKTKTYIILYLLIFLLALTLRLYSINHLQGFNENGLYAEPIQGDEPTFYELGKHVFLGDGPVEFFIWNLWSHKEVPHLNSFYPPFYPYIIGTIFSIFGESSFVVRVFSLFISLITVCLVGIFGLRLYNKEVGLLAMFLIAINPAHVFNSGLITREPLFTFLVFIFLILFYFAVINRNLFYWILVGALLGILTITNYFGFILLGVVLIILLIKHRRIKLSYAIISLILFTLVILPVGIQTYREFGTPFHSDLSYYKYTDDYRESYYEDVPPTFSSFLELSLTEKIYPRLFGVGRVLVTLPRLFTPVIFSFVLLSLFFLDSFILVNLAFFSVFLIIFILFTGPSYLIGEKYFIQFLPTMLIAVSVVFKKGFNKLKSGAKRPKIIILIILVFTLFFSLGEIQHDLEDYSKADKSLFDMGGWIKENTPADSFIMSFSSPTLHYLTERIVINNPYTRTALMNPNELKEESKTIHIEQVKKYNVSFLLIRTDDQLERKIINGFDGLNPEEVHREGKFVLYKFNFKPE